MAFVRRNSGSLTDTQQNNFIKAINNLITSGKYATFVNYHAPTMSAGNLKIHGMSGEEGLWRFLAWHRMYLIEFEKVLKVPLPYWKWDQPVPDWVDNFMPAKITGIVERDIKITPNMKKQKINIKHERQSVGKNMVLLPTNPKDKYTQVELVLRKKTIKEFTIALEQLHNGAHSARRGVMNSNISPADPIFWLLHSNVDRIWQKWQFSGHSSKKFNPRMPSHIDKRWSKINIGVKSYQLIEAVKALKKYNIRYV